MSRPNNLSNVTDRHFAKLYGVRLETVKIYRLDRCTPLAAQVLINEYNRSPRRDPKHWRGPHGRSA